MRKKLTKRSIDSFSASDRPYRVFDTELTGFHVHVAPSGRKTFYLRFVSPVDGKRKDFKLGPLSSTKVAEARDQAESQRGDINKGHDPQIERKAARRLLEEARKRTLRAFLTNVYAGHVKETRKTAEEAVKRIKAQFPSWLDLPMSEISEWDLRSWRQAAQKKGKAETTINRDLAELSALLSHAVRLEVLNKSPFEGLSPLKGDDRKIVRYLSEDEENSLRQALRDRDQEIRAKRKSANLWRLERSYQPLPDLEDRFYVDHLEPMVLLSLNTGLRRGELFQLRWENVDLYKNVLSVEGRTTKNRRTRRLPLSVEAAEVLRNWKDSALPRSAVFTNRDGAPITDIKKPWAAVLDRAGIRNFRWHDLRHHFASRLVHEGVDLFRVKELLGHSSIQVTERYAHPSQAALVDAIGRIGLRSRRDK